MSKVKIDIEVNAAQGTAAIKGFTATVEEKVKTMSNSSIDNLRRLERQISKGVGGALSWLGGQLTDLKTLALGALTGWGLASLAQGFLDTGGKMEAMRISLDTLTKGQGAEWFEQLNTWALKMPVNTERAIQSFILMRAMGLQPTIDDMTTLSDATSALGGNADTLEGIARALGQIKTKGKVSAEELMQLAERGIPAYEILQQKLGLTADQVANIGNAGIDADMAIAALLDGMDDRYAGQSVKMQTAWQGLMESLKSYWSEFKRLVMESGLMEWLQQKIGGVVAQLDAWAANGQLKIWAQETGQYIQGMLQWIWDKGIQVYQWWQRNNEEIIGQFTDLITKIQEVGNTLANWWNRYGGIITTIGSLAAKGVGFAIDIARAPSNYSDQVNADSWVRANQQQYYSNQARGVGLDFNIPSSYNIPTSYVTSYASGTTAVPKTGPYLLHQGETVTRAGSAKTPAAPVSFGDIHIHLPPGSAPQRDSDWRATVRDFIAPELRRLSHA